MRAGVVDAALRQLAGRIATATLEAAGERRAEGQLEFHDLLVLARDLLAFRAWRGRPDQPAAALPAAAA